ncbi:hypothetical protein WJX77_001232 [Trebouxia sp. C0004]
MAEAGKADLKGTAAGAPDDKLSLNDAEAKAATQVLVVANMQSLLEQCRGRAVTPQHQLSEVGAGATSLTVTPDDLSSAVPSSTGASAVGSDGVKASSSGGAAASASAGADQRSVLRCGRS